MNLYGVKDLLLNIMAPPFVAPSDNQAITALANIVNRGRETDPYAQAPHHFQLWQLATIDEEGNVSPTKIILTDLSSLVRADIRQDGERRPPTGTSPAGARRSPAGGPDSGGDTEARATPDTPTGSGTTPGETSTGTRGLLEQHRR